jgi:hypothetical protein
MMNLHEMSCDEIQTADSVVGSQALSRSDVEGAFGYLLARGMIEARFGKNWAPMLPTAP